MLRSPTLASRFFFFPALLVTVMLHFALFGEGTHNPIGIRPLTEMYLALCMGFALLLLFSATENTAREFRLLLYYGIFTCVVFIGGPMIFAYFTYGQPLLYGFIEERRVLFCLGFAPLLYFGKRVTGSQFERAILYTALLAAVLSWGFKFGLVPDWREEVASYDRPDRSSIGAHLLCFAFFYCVQLWSLGESPLDGSKRSKNVYLLVAVFLLLTLVFATQTRQLILLCLVFTLFYLRARAVLWALCVGVFIAPLVLYPEVLKMAGLDLSFYNEQLDQGVEDTVRSNTINSIFGHLDIVNWLPSGSLSLMWQDGFIPYFGEHFFLSDVGLFGDMFRFGLLTFIVLPVTFFVYNRIAKSLDPNMSFTYPAILAYMVIWPLNSLTAYTQSIIAMLFVLHALKAQYARSQERNYERRTYSQLQGCY